MCHIVQILSHKFRALLCHFILCWTYSTIKTKEERHGFFWLFNHSMQERYRTLPAYMGGALSPTGSPPLGGALSPTGLIKLETYLLLT